MAPQWEGPWLDLEDFPCKSEVWWVYVGLVFHEAFWNSRLEDESIVSLLQGSK